MEWSPWVVDNLDRDIFIIIVLIIKTIFIIIVLIIKTIFIIIVLIIKTAPHLSLDATVPRDSGVMCNNLL